MVTATLPPPSSPGEAFIAPVDLDDFRISTAGEVLAMLRTLLDQGVRVTLSNAGGASLNTQLGLIDLKRGLIGFEVHAGDAHLQALMDGNEEIQAAAYLDRIRLQFPLAAAALMRSAEGPLLCSKLPSVLYRIQRRQAFRVRPQTRQAMVRVKHPDSLEPVAARILDLSVGGLAMQLPPGIASWPAGTSLAVLVELDRETHFNCMLRLQHVHAGDDTGTPLGCAFDKLDLSALRTLQAYIDQAQKLERLMRKE